MSTFLLIISAICFISAFGIHMFAKHNVLDWCGYMSVPILSMIPWVSGFILAVIPETLFLQMDWWWVFLLNIPFLLLFGPFLTKMFLRRLSSGKGAGVDILIALITGIVTLTIALIL